MNKNSVLIISSEYDRSTFDVSKCLKHFGYECIYVANADYSDCWDDSTGKDVSTTVVASGASDAYDGCSTSATTTSPISV